MDASLVSDLTPLPTLPGTNPLVADLQPIAAQLGQPRAATGLVESMQAGFQGSVPGLAWRGRLPDLVLDPEHAKWWERAATGIAQVGSELLIMGAGAAIGAPAGAAVGGAITGPAAPAGAAIGGILGAGAGMFAVPGAIRESLMQAYKSGEIKTAAEWFNIVREVATATAKEALVGATTFGVGGIAARTVGKAIAPSIGQTITTGTAVKAIGAADVAGQIAGMVTMPAALQGRLPDAIEFMDAAIVIGGLKLAHPIAKRMATVFEKTGKTPAEQVADVQEGRVSKEEFIGPPEPPTDPAELRSLLVTRLTELTEKSEGTPDRTVTGPDDQPMTIPGKQREFMTDAERRELAFLKANIDNPEALADTYRIRRAGAEPTVSRETPLPWPDPIKVQEQLFTEVARRRDLEGTVPVVTPEATTLIREVDRGNAPAGMTEDLRRIATDNGIEVTDATTPKTVVDAIRAKMSDQDTLISRMTEEQALEHNRLTAKIAALQADLTRLKAFETSTDRVRKSVMDAMANIDEARLRNDLQTMTGREPDAMQTEKYASDIAELVVKRIVQRAQRLGKTPDEVYGEYVQLKSGFWMPDARLDLPPHRAALEEAARARRASMPPAPGKIATLIGDIQALGGIDKGSMTDTLGDNKVSKGVPFGLFHKNGESLDDLVVRLNEAPYHWGIDTNTPDGGIKQLQEMIRAEASSPGAYHRQGDEAAIGARNERDRAAYEVQAIKKALAGEKTTEQEEAIVRQYLDEHDAMAKLGPQEYGVASAAVKAEPELTGTAKDAIDAVAVERALAKDPEAVETADAMSGGDNAAFMREIRRILGEPEPSTDTSGEANARAAASAAEAASNRAAIERDGTQAVRDAIANGSLEPDTALAISAAALGNEASQAIGIRAVSEGSSTLFAVNLMKAAEIVRGEKPALDPAGIVEAENLAGEATKRQMWLAKAIETETDTWKKSDLQWEQHELDSWQTKPELIAKLRELKQGPVEPFELAPETPAELQARNEEAVAQAKRKLIEERNAERAAKGLAPFVDQADLFNTQGTLFQSQPGEWYYSELARQIERLPANRVPAEGMSAEQWKKLIWEPETTKRVGIRDEKNKPTGEFREVVVQGKSPLPGVTRDEINASQVGEWLSTMPEGAKVTREQVLDFIKKGGLRVQDVVLGHAGEKTLADAAIADDVRLLTERGFAPDLNPEEPRLLAFMDRETNDLVSAREMRNWVDEPIGEGGVPLDVVEAAERVQQYWRGEAIRAHTPENVRITNPTETGWTARSADGRHTMRIQSSTDIPDATTAREVAARIFNQSDQTAEANALQGGPTQFGTYQLPGGKNYREAFITLPDVPASQAKDLFTLEKHPMTGDWLIKSNADGHTMGRLNGGLSIEDATVFARANYKETVGGQGTWSDGHGLYDDIKNPIMRYRFNEREIPREPIAPISDIGRRLVEAVGARSESTLGSGAPIVGLRKGVITQAEAHAYAKAKGFTNADDFKPAAVDRVMFLEELQPPVKAEFAKMPEYLQKNWLEMGIKRVMVWAAQNGFDKVSWTTGTQQVERYTTALRKNVDAIEWEKTPEGVQLVGYKGRGGTQPSAREEELLRREAAGTNTPTQTRELAILNRERHNARQKVVDTRYAENELTDALGKAMADRIRNDPGQKGVIEGENLRIDETGMYGLYDRMVPATVNRILKDLKVGGKVGQAEIGIGATTDAVPEFKRFDRHDYDAWGGAEEFGRDDSPLKSIVDVEIDGAKQKVEVVIDKNGIHFLTEDGESDFYTERRQLSASPWHTGRQAMQSIEGAWKDPTSPLWEKLQDVIGGAKSIKPVIKTTGTQMSFDITPELKDKATAGLPLFQKLREEHRAAYSKAEKTITLFKTADRSSILHELTHDWVEELKQDAARPDAPQQLKDDWNILRREFAIPEAGNIPTIAHEQLAKTGERYFAEGEAPSIALRGIFERLRVWMLDIYKSVEKILGLEINPDVRGVFDRMLASDEKIAAARELGVPRAYVGEAKAAEARKIVPGEAARRAAENPFTDELPPGPGEAPDNIHVNYEYINGPMDLKLAMQRMAEIDQANIQKRRGGVEGVKSWEMARAEQKRYVEELLGGEPGALDAFINKMLGAGADELQIDTMYGIIKKTTTGAAKDAAMRRDVILAHGHDATVREQLDYMGALERVRMLQAEMLGQRAAIARAMNAMKDVNEGSGEIAKMLEVIGVGDNTMFQSARTPAEEQAYLKVKLDEILQNYRGKSVLDIARLHKEIGTLKGSFEFAKKTTEATKWEMVVEGWKSSLLSGPVTHTTNLFGTGAFQALRAPVDALATVIGMARGASPGMGESDRASMSEAVARVTGMLGGIQDAMKVGYHTFKADQATGKTESYREAIPGQAGHLIRIPLRLMGAEDAIVKTMYRRGELKTLAIRQAFDENLNPGTREFAERVDALMDAPPEAMAVAADTVATRMTFNAPLGEKGVSLQLFVNKWNLQWMIPFIRTPINIAKELARMSPFAPVVGEWRADIAKGGVARDRALAEIALGSGIMALTMAYTFSGNISGGGSPDPGKNRGKSGVWQPYSILIDGKWYEYARIQPTGTLMGMAADIADVWDHMTEEEKDKVPKMLARAFANAITNQTFLQGITNVVNAISDPTRFGTRFFQQMAGSLVPNIVGQPTAMADPYVREVNSALEAIQARVPGMREQLIPKRDWLGKPIETKERPLAVMPVRIQPVTEDKVRLEAARLDISMAAAPKKTHIGKGTGKMADVELTPEERDTFEKVGGEMAHKILTNIVGAPGYDQIPDMVKKKIFAKVLTASHQVAAVAALPMDKRIAYIQSISEKVAAALEPEN